MICYTELSTSMFKIINTFFFSMLCSIYDYDDYNLQFIAMPSTLKIFKFQTLDLHYLPSILRVQCTEYDRTDIVMPPEKEPTRRQGVVIVRKGALCVCMLVTITVQYSLPLVVSEGDSLGGHLEVDYSGGRWRVGTQSHTGGFLHSLATC